MTVNALVIKVGGKYEIVDGCHTDNKTSYVLLG